ncbi:hypothetical protein JCM3765_005979 [Sporobolomyces pararoseus]
MQVRPGVGGGRGSHTRGYSQQGRAAGIAKQQELSSAYSALAAELTKTEIKSVGGYTLGRIIGQGTFGKVRLGVHRLTGTRVAIKQVSKSLSSSNSNSSDPSSSPLSLLTREIHHHRRLRHPHVLSLYELIATESSIYLVTELCAGGELFDYLVEKGRLPLEETRQLFGQLVLGIAYLHGEGVVHRDLKLENVLLDERCRVKVADFGFGREFERGKWMDTWVGTLGYCAPEVISGKKYLGEEVDIWSLGVIFYALVTGSLPFDDDDEGIMKEMILKCEYEIPTWLDEDAADLIRNILVLDPLRRLSLKQILSHPFFTRPSPALTRRPTFSRSHSYSSSISSSIHHHPLGSNQIIQEEFDHPPAILEQEEHNLTSSPSIGFLGAEIDPLRVKEEDRVVPEADESATSQSSHLGSTSQPRTGASSPLTSVEGQEREEDQVELLSEVQRGKLRMKDENQQNSQDELAAIDQSTNTLTNLPSPGRLSAPPSPVPPSRSSFDATPSLRRNRSNSSSVRSLPFHNNNNGNGTHGTCTPHARTPARTKRRSIGSIISERLVSLVEEDPNLALPNSTASPSSLTSPASLLLPRVDYLSLMLSTIHREDLFSSESERELLERLEGLGFDTGQMKHSVNHSACDSSSATFWMLKKKMEEKESEKLEAEAIAAAAAAGAGEGGEGEVNHASEGDRKDAVETRTAESGPGKQREEEEQPILELPQTRIQEPTPTHDLFSTTTERIPSPPAAPPRSSASPIPPPRISNTTAPLPSTSDDRLEYFLGQHSSNAPPAPEYFPTIDPGSPTRRRTKSRDDVLLSPRSQHSTLVPLDSPLELSPTSKARNEEEAKNRRSRSGSVTLLARATSALNNSLNLKGREDSPGPEEQQSSGLFRRKSSLPLDELTPTNRTPPLPSTSAPSSPRRNSSNSPFRNADPSTPPRPAVTSKPALSPGPSPSVSLANSVDTFDTIASSTSSGKPRTAGAGAAGSKKGTKGSQLLANLKFWFGDAQRKRNKSRSSPARASEGSSFATGVVRSHSLNAGGGYRAAAQSGYVASPLRRPLPGSRRSSNASIAPLSRRSSVSSAHRTALHDQLARPQLAHHRRRSDSSRTSISGGDHSRPQSVRSFTGGGGVSQQQQGSPSDATQGARRNRHGKAPSTSSAGSFSKEAVYRRPPTTTTVRRRHPSHGRHNHRRSASGASSIRTHRSSTSSIGEGGSDDEAFGEAGEAPILEEDETEDKESRPEASPPSDDEHDVARREARLKALRTLSGDFSALQISSTSSSSSAASSIIAQPSPHLLTRPPLPHNPSSRASSRSDSSSVTRSRHSHATFSAHKSTHLFGSPLQPSSSTRKSALPPPRPPLRDVFASKSTIGESDWVDEDELDCYGGGLGQGNSTSSTTNVVGNGNLFGGSSTSLGTLDETRAIGGAGNGDSPVAEKTFVGGGGMSLFEGRYAGVNGSGNANGRGVRTLSAIKTVVIEEDEEEEED